MAETLTPEVWTTTPEGIPVLDVDATFFAMERIEDALDAAAAEPWWTMLPFPTDGSEPTVSFDVGVCWCGAYGRAGAIHNAKPSPDEPVEECGRYL